MPHEPAVYVADARWTVSLLAFRPDCASDPHATVSGTESEV